MTSCIVAQSAVLKSSGPFHPNDDNGYPRIHPHELASTLRCVVIKQNGNTNPSPHTILLVMELRADLEDGHHFHDTRHEPEDVTRDIAKAMHLSLDFLQSMTDLDGAFEWLVIPCLDLANRITYMMDTSELGDPEAVSTIKRLRQFQSERMHQLRERWGDLLQTASEFDESATFEQLSDIVEYTEDAVREVWLKAKSFESSCEEKLRYRLNDTF